MLDSLVITLRETLEASLLISFLLVLSKSQKINFFWISYSLVLGTTVAFFIANFMPQISDMADGTGQEILFTSVLFTIAFLLLIIHLFLHQPPILKLKKISQQYFSYLFIVSVLLAISLEGAEITIYIQSQLFVTQKIYSSVTGSLLGLGIGISTAILFYYLLTQALYQHSVMISRIFISLISAGMVSQGLAYLMQAGIMESGQPIWDSSWIVSETSLVGQLLYALIGYESTPTLLQLSAYSFILIFAFILPVIDHQLSPKFEK